MKPLQVFCIVFLIFFSTLYFYPFYNMDRFIMETLVAFVILTLIFFMTKRESNTYLNGQPIKHSYIFLLGFVIVHFQFYIDYVLRNLTESDYRVWIDQTIVIKSFALSICGLLAFLVGYLSVNEKKGRQYEKNAVRENYKTMFLQFFTVILLLAFYATVDPRYLIGYYGQVELSPEANYSQFGFQVTAFAVIIQNVRNAFYNDGIEKISFKKYITGVQGIFFSIVVMIYLLSVMLSGDRGPLISMSLCYFAGFLSLTKFKFNRSVFVIGILLTAFAITLLGQVRHMDKDISFVDRLVMALEGDASTPVSIGDSKSVIPQTKELANSVRALHLAVWYVPDKHEFMYGRFQFQQVLGMIPFGTEFKNLLFDELSYRYIGSGQFITWIEQGDQRFYGLGTTCVADFYLDFGLLGVVLGMLFFGILIRKSELAMYSAKLPTMPLHVFSFVYLAFSLYISRSTVLFNLKLCAFIIIALVINKYILNGKRS